MAKVNMKEQYEAGSNRAMKTMKKKKNIKHRRCIVKPSLYTVMLTKAA